jgi:hypothetical protein
MIEHTDITILGTTTLKTSLASLTRSGLRQQRLTSQHFDSPSFELPLYEAASTPYTFRKSITTFTRTFTIGLESCAASTPATNTLLRLPPR